MRALCYADLQATDGHERSFTDPTKLLQIQRLEHFFDEIERIYQEQHCDALWDLGDTTDDRTAIPVPVIDLLCDRLEKFKGDPKGDFKERTRGDWNIKLIGNHEQFLRDTNIHAGKMFRRFFTVVESTRWFACGKVNIICVSYHDNDAVMLDFLRRNRAQPKALLLGHFEVFGAQMPSGLSAGGLPRRELDFVNIGLLGHVHKPQSLGKLHYVGSPFQQNWGEAGETKRVAIVDIPDDDSVNITWVPLQGFPVYRQVSFADFVKLATPNSEDRFKVVLRSVAEAEAFYAHPLAGREDEVIYDFAATVESTGTVAADMIPRTKQDVMRQYLDKNPASAWNIDLSAEEMVAFGDQVSTGT